jgi:excisionase family DNA binding protein
LSEALLSVKEVAAYLGVSEDFVLRRAAAGELPSFAFPGPSGVRCERRFRREEVDAWLERYRVSDKVVPLRQSA